MKTRPFAIPLILFSLLTSASLSFFELPINLFPMSNTNDKNRNGLIPDFANHPIISDSIPPKSGMIATQRFAP